MKANVEPLLPDKYYHIYNLGINGETIFKKKSDYQLFLDKYAFHVTPYINTFAYCLLDNHFHFLIQVKPSEELFKEAEKKYPRKKI